MTQGGSAADKEGLIAVFTFTTLSLILMFIVKGWFFWVGLGLLAVCMLALGQLSSVLSLIGLTLTAVLGVYEGFFSEESQMKK